MSELPIILDDFINEQMQNEIEDSLFDCVWYYLLDNTLGSKSSDSKYRKFLNPLEYKINPTFCANLLYSLNDQIYEKVKLLIKKSCDRINFEIEKVDRCYVGVHALISNLQESELINAIHVNKDIPHLVMLYYVNDSDGDTILYDKTFYDIPSDIDNPELKYDLKITHKISPKRGRVLFFDGKFFHAASTPTKNIRSIITVDLFGKFKENKCKFFDAKKSKKMFYV